jgi:8-oxo-dGTP pyrophosphatase MutT (NUDIX family)
MMLRRQAARVVLLDARGHALMQQAVDPADPSVDPWWELPGGGMHHGERSEDAAARELYEETGIRDFEMGPCVWVRHTQFRFGGWHFDQHERIHVAWCDVAHESRPVALEALEAAAFLGVHWWSVDDLLTSPVQCWPSRIRDYLPDLVAGRLPSEPIDVGH